MLFNSVEFLIFFPIVCLGYYIIPNRVRYIWLLLVSYFFYMCWDVKYSLLLLFSTFITYVSGILIKKEIEKGENVSNRRKKAYVAISFILNLAILIIFKYLDWMIESVNSFINIVGGEYSFNTLSLILPVGISFYIFQALSYTVDVYRCEVEAQTNFAKYALFVSFFPQLVAGPIERSKNLLRQIDEQHYFKYDRMIRGLLLMLWGYFLKLVIADRVAIYVDCIFADYSAFDGAFLVLAAILFGIQIYCDFAGYSSIAIGAAEIMGFHLMENFNCPYLSESVAEFWRRWHISLSTWFRDYLYIPLGGNRKGLLRKYVNLMIVFCVSGLWHGANLTYLVWGGANGLYQIFGEIFKPLKKLAIKILHLHTESWGHKLLKKVITFVLIDVAWIFFRAETITDAISIFKIAVTNFHVVNLLNGSLYKICLNQKNFEILWFAIGILLISDLFKSRGIVIRDVIIRQDLWFRWCVYICAIFFVLIFGIWGGTYDAASFIYFQF